MNLESFYMYIYVWFINLGKKFVIFYKKLVYFSLMVF